MATLQAPFESYPTSLASSPSSHSLRPALHVHVETDSPSRAPRTAAFNSPPDRENPRTPSPPHTHQGELTFSPGAEHSPDLHWRGARTAGASSTDSRTRNLAPQPSTSTPSGVTPSEIFLQLDAIKALHREIAQEHAKLESIGPGTGAGASGATDHAKDKEKERGRGSKAEKKTPNEYESMASDFDSRKEGVDKVMAKVGRDVPHGAALRGRVALTCGPTRSQLSQLSETLKKFHNLEIPVSPSHLFSACAGGRTFDLRHLN